MSRVRTQVSFECTRTDYKRIAVIAKRAVAMARDLHVEYDQQWAVMDLTATHANGCPLDFDKLLAADDANFGHDVFGIRRFLDRKTGKLTACFVPRCAAPQLDPVIAAQAKAAITKARRK